MAYLREIVDNIDGDFNMYIRGIKLIDNRREPIPRDLLNCKVNKISFSDLIDIYLVEEGIYGEVRE